jgi:Nuclease-related domain
MPAVHVARPGARRLCADDRRGGGSRHLARPGPVVVVRGGVTGGLATLAWLMLGAPPEHIATWGRGAAGERLTAKVLCPLVREGWTVAHDVPLSRGNLDHVLVGPPGVFLLETKFRAGRARLEDGVLTIRYADDPDEVSPCHVSKTR